jgi:transcriptional regulator with XRE-family HTH domain
MYMALKDNLKRLREERGLSQTGLAKLAVVSQQLISRLESGLDLTTKKLPEIARALSVTPSEIDENFAIEDRGSVLAAPLISWVNAGPLEAHEPLPLDQDGNPERKYTAGITPIEGDWVAFKVKGDSMDRISPPDSFIFVNQNDRRLVTNACYVIKDVDGGLSYKRYRSGPARWEPVSTNKKHKTYLVKGDRGPIVTGRVKRTMLDL